MPVETVGTNRLSRSRHGERTEFGGSDVRGFGGIALRAFRHTQFQLPCGGLLLASQSVEQGKMALCTRYVLRVWGMVDTDFRLSAWLRILD